MDTGQGQSGHIQVRVTPGAARNEITGFADGVLKVKVTAPPVEGKANAALIKLLSRELRVPRTSVTIVKGRTGRNKTISITGLSAGEVLDRLFSNKERG